MNGMQRAQLQEYSGVREIVSDLDKIRCKYGIGSVNVLTPRAEVNIRLGKVAQIPLKYEIVSEALPCKVIFEFPMKYPKEPLSIFLEPAIPDGLESPEMVLMSQTLNEIALNNSGNIGYALELLQLVQSGFRQQQQDGIEIEVNAILSQGATEQTSVAQQDSELKAATSYKCRKCRFLLFSADLIENHPRPSKASPSCSSLFLCEPPDDHWLQPVVTADVNGKIHCPSCEAKVGTFNWSGSKCSCGAWIVPSIQFASGKIDQPPMAPIESISMGAPPLWPLPPLQTLSLVTPIDASAEDGASAEVDSDSQNRSTNQEKL